MPDQPPDFQKIAEALWTLLDDIDTLDDVAKDNAGDFRRWAMTRVEQRHKYATSDGFTLTNWRLP